MTLPNFLGIGAPKCGTTWLHELLSSHPSIYVPQRRKEIRFFHRYYNRGTSWYETFFPSDKDSKKYQAIGEITPGYLYCSCCPERIAGIKSIMRLLLILRNPTDRAYSSYIHWVRGKNYTESFENFLSDYKPALQYGFYSRYLKNYLSIFKREQILILIFERAVNNIPGTKTKLADFLGLSAEEFPEQSGFERANRGYIPKFKFAYGIVNRITDLIRYKWKQDAIVDWYLDLARRLRIKRLFGDVGTLSKMKEETRKYLDDLYNDEIRQLESLFEVDLSCWKHK